MSSVDMRAGWLRRWARRLLTRSVSGQSLALFRITFGLIAAAQAYSLITPAGASWLEGTLTGKDVVWNIPFPLLEWVRPWPEPWMRYQMLAVVVGGIALALGVLTRPAALVLLFGWSHLWLCESMEFNNHYYLTSVIAFLLLWMPSDRCWSVAAAWRRRRSGKGGPGEPGHSEPADSEPGARGDIPVWPVTILRAQLFFLYFYGGVAKLTYDYLVRGEPMRWFVTAAAESSRLEGWLTPAQFEWLSAVLAQDVSIRALSMAGLAFDLVVPFLLLFGRTRLLGLVLTALFHGINHFVLFTDIGWFPLLGLIATLIFLPPDWPGRLGGWLRRPRTRRPDWWRPDWRWLVGGAVVVPMVGAALGWRIDDRDDDRDDDPARPSTQPLGSLGYALIALWVAIQLTLPLRPFLIPGDVAWTAEGLLFSWRMKFNSRVTDLHGVTVEDPTTLERSQPSDVRYRHLSAPYVAWTDLPQLLVVHEPSVGWRVVVHPEGRDGQFTPGGDLAGEVTAWWRQTFGRTPQVEGAVGLHRSLIAAAKLLEQGAVDPAVHAELVAAAQLAVELLAGGLDEPRLLVATTGLRRRLERLAGDPTLGPVVARILARMPPLTLAGARHVSSGFLVVDDPGFVPGQASERWPGSSVIYTDFRRLAPEDWRRLPRTIPLADGAGKATATTWWNVHRDLRSETRRRWLLAYPAAQRMYARRIARLWQAEHGTRPAVHVRSYVRVNFHPPRSLVDPRVDLASAGYRWLAHNEWIAVSEDYPPDPGVPVSY